MQQADSLISRFMGCDNTQEAIAITESCDSSNAFMAVVDMNGSYIQISKTAKKMLGCDLNRLRKETIFSMTSDSDRTKLFKACSTTVMEGEVYRVINRGKCNENKDVPLVTHMKVVKGLYGDKMILCMNVKA